MGVRGFGPGSRARPRGPEDEIVVAVGDIHGCDSPLKHLIGRVEACLSDDELQRVRFVFLGDYCDRGVETPAVLDRLIALGKRYPSVFLRGNHEQMLLDFLEGRSSGESWIRFGGRETLGSYGVRWPSDLKGKDLCADLRRQFAERLPQSHRAFLNATELSYEAGDFLFVHAGIDPKEPIDKQQARSLLWIREPFLSSKKRYERFVVHGHNAAENVDHRHNRLGIDTGAYATGVLTAAVIAGSTLGLIDSAPRRSASSGAA